MPITTILTDIEGTIGSISFVKDVLFPFARERLPAFVRAKASEPEVRAQLDAVAEREGLAREDIDAQIAALLRWSDQDLKLGPLKTLQGLIWAEGFHSGKLVAHLYDDALRAFERWRAQGLPIYVYSSGSVGAQRLYFAHTVAGNLSATFAGHFDTAVGAKGETASYQRILEEIKVPAQDVLFLSDVVTELDAARSAGLATVHVKREGNTVNSAADSGTHRCVTSFNELAP